jgi:tRNA threonylcarbamoyladenosine biosynthesis protein TsaB
VESLAPGVAECLALASTSPRELSAIVCGAGPGGFTSLRSAAALAKGLCSALAIPLYAVSSLEVLAWSAEIGDGALVAAIAAGRNEWFGIDATCDDGRVRTTSDAYLMDEARLRAHAAALHARLAGPALEHDVRPRADAMLPRLSEIFARGPVDLDRWEPTYGRLAEAQVKWEASHGRPLPV